MHVFAADDLEAADALALARLDDDGAPPAVTPATGQGRQVIRLAGAGQVTARQAEMTAAAPGRARQQLTPALTGVAPRRASHPRLRVPAREGNSVMPEPAATRPRPASPPPRRYTYPGGSAPGPARVPGGPVIAAVAERGQACRAERVGGRR